MVKRMATAPPSAEATRASKRVKTSHTPAATNASASAATPASDPIYRPGKFGSTDVSSIPCELCKSVTSTRSDPMLLCDGCNHGFHTTCFKISQIPAKDCDWLCESFKRDKKWHNGVVRAQYPNSAGTEVAYENGIRALENLNALKWRPLYTTDLSPMVAHIDTFSVCSAQNLSIWLSTCPKSLAHLKKFPQVVQEKWLQSRLKEFKSIIGKGAAEVIDRSQVPPNAIVIPSAWVFRVKLDGSLKSRLVLLGHLMPKDADFDLSSPTPRLSSVRFLLVLILKLGL
jgi:hypothetical protein